MMRKIRPQKTIGSQKPLRSDQGFTILETAFALVVMMVAALGAVSIFAYSIENNASAKDRELAMGVAQQHLEQLRNATFTDALLTATDVEGRTTEVESAERRYTVVTTIADSEVVNGQPTLKTIRIRVTPVGTLASVTLVTHRATTVIGPNR
jgi:Tfp pilus assembly protein PilV